MENNLLLLGVVAICAAGSGFIFAKAQWMKKGVPRMPLGPPTGLANVSDRTLHIPST